MKTARYLMGLLLFTSQAPAGEGNCLLEQCESDPIPHTSHPTELNVLGAALQSCSTEPLTGFYRDGYCRTGSNDRGIHVVCAEVTETFLAYTKSKGNDLSSAAPQYGFPGLQPGDRWCLCATRWSEAKQAGTAPPVILSATSDKSLDKLSLSDLQKINAQMDTKPSTHNRQSRP